MRTADIIVKGLFTMTGDSGTSFKTGPAIGKCLAEWITEGHARTSRLFVPHVLLRGKPWQEEFTYGLVPPTVAR